MENDSAPIKKKGTPIDHINTSKMPLALKPSAAVLRIAPDQTAKIIANLAQRTLVSGAGTEPSRVRAEILLANAGHWAIKNRNIPSPISGNP